VFVCDVCMLMVSRGRGWWFVLSVVVHMPCCTSSSFAICSVNPRLGSLWEYMYVTTSMF
jgi:hypothetical protein